MVLYLTPPPRTYQLVSIWHRFYYENYRIYSSEKLARNFPSLCQPALSYGVATAPSQFGNQSLLPVIQAKFNDL
jgi:hypothetical protein